MDGANMNAQVGLTSPAAIGADVCHLNLHKTFCIPHGGGGPGMGPIGVAAHLAPYPARPSGGRDRRRAGDSRGVGGAVGQRQHPADLVRLHPDARRATGMTDATRSRSSTPTTSRRGSSRTIPVLYTRAERPRRARDDLRPAAVQAGERHRRDDVAKRLMDYGFHAPTVSFPVAGTLMVEPTESEPKDELDRFCDAMIAHPRGDPGGHRRQGRPTGQRAEERAAHRRRR